MTRSILALRRVCNIYSIHLQRRTTNTNPTKPIQERKRDVMKAVGSSLGGGGSNKAEIEVEQKFALPTASDVEAVEKKLQSLGFEKEKVEVFTDWYFDLPPPNWCLTPNDCWLRYREYYVDTDDASNLKKKNSGWQFKRRPESLRKSPSAGSQATVYEEIEGKEAIEAALTMLPDNRMDKEKIQDDGDSGVAKKHFEEDIPAGLPEGSGLQPFAKFETRRTGWVKCDNGENDKESQHALRVDLDGTDFGYMVGEVETIVDDESEIDAAKDSIMKLVLEIVGPDKDTVAGDEHKMGKLSTFMMKYCREQFDLCVKSGVI